jgi:UDP-N-acetylmuramoylalanine--D-glutamate ligase
VWISGTNGKTTTTQMLAYLLEEKGALSGGNIGTPLAELDPTAPLWILETSSYTLHHTRFASPDIYLLLPVSPDHLDWHGTPEAYEADKLAPLRTMREGELALIPGGLDIPESHAWMVEYDSNSFLEKFFGLDVSRLRYRAGFLQDALLALAVTRTLFDETDYDRLNSFSLDRHRQEEITDKRGRLWVNDSKATNLDAALQALESYAGYKIHLIAGGDDKGVDMEPLIRRLSELDAELYTIGSNSARLTELAGRYSLAAHTFKTLKEAQEAVSARMGMDNEVALLSPAAASLDQFSSYAERGDEFVKFVNGIK